MKKKLISTLLCAAMTASMLAGCGNGGDTNTDAPAKEDAAEDKADETVDSTEASQGSDAAASGGVSYEGELSLMHYSTSEESEGNGGSDGFRTMLLT